MKWKQATFQKIIWNNDSEQDSGSGKRMEAKIEKMQEMFTKHLEKLKNKQTEMNNTLQGIDSRIMDAEEQISDLEDRMVQITATKQNAEKMNEKK